jgi:hypothetical protein
MYGSIDTPSLFCCATYQLAPAPDPPQVAVFLLIKKTFFISYTSGPPRLFRRLIRPAGRHSAAGPAKV